MGMARQVLKTKLFEQTEKNTIDKHDISQKCRICQTKDESLMHIESGCEGLAKQKYKVRHDAVRRRVP